jgi:hypothetical protein
MAVPSYTTDLTTYDDATDEATGWDQLTGMTVGGGVAQDPDLAIHGSICQSQDRAKVGLGSIAVTLTGPTLPTDGVFLVWAKFFAPNSLDTIAAGGNRILIGSGIGDYYGWYVDGSDTYGYGGWVNYAVDPTFTPVDQTQGSPGAAYNTVGAGWKVINAIAKGNPETVDIIRYGRGIAEFSVGDITTPATFAGYALVNDNPTTGRFGLFQDQGGSYLWKGLMSIGLAATAVYMVDANVNITIDNTLHVADGFNRIEIHNTGSTVEWTSINIGKVGTVSLGEFEVVTSADLTMTGCVFTDMSTFIFLTTTNDNTLVDCTWRRCAQVTGAGALMSGCVFDESTDLVALTVTDASIVSTATDISGLTFNSDGTGHAIEGFNTADDYTFVDFNFTGYTGATGTSGSTGNETISVLAAAGTVNIFLSGGSGTVSYKTAGATVNVILSATLVVGGVRAASDVWIYRADNKTLLASADPVAVTDGPPIEGVQYYKLTYTYDAATLDGVGTEIKVFNLDYLPVRINYPLTTDDATVGIQQTIDRNYSNP